MLPTPRTCLRRCLGVPSLVLFLSTTLFPPHHQPDWARLHDDPERQDSHKYGKDESQNQLTTQQHATVRNIEAAEAHSAQTLSDRIITDVPPACRIRKLGCERLPGSARCEPCKRVDVDCTFTHVRQRPGPRPGYRSKIPSTSGPSQTARRSSHGTQSSATMTVEPISPNRRSSSVSQSTLGTGTINPLDSVLPRDLLIHLVQLYFDYISWIIPFPHRPSFERDLANGREENSGQDEWIATVFGLITYALTLPRQLLPLTTDEVSALGSACFEHLLTYLRRDYDVCSVNRLYVIYCTAGFAFSKGYFKLCRELNGSVISLAIQQNLDRESTYATMEPLEREMYRRMWWLLYSADRSGATTEGARPLLNEDLCSSVALPSTLDDESLELAAQGLLVDKPNPTVVSPLWGFFYSSAMWRVAGKIHSRRERDIAVPPHPDDLRRRIMELDEIIEELDDLFVDCPSFLALHLDTEIGSPDLPCSGGRSSLSPAKHGIGVQQSNLWVSQQAIRLVAVQYRKDLVDMYSLSSLPTNTVLPHGEKLRSQKKKQSELSFRQNKDQILSTLLRVLQALPMELMAVNSFPGLGKIRYVASTLLGDFSEEGCATDDQASQRSFTALTYLQQYIDYLSQLESMSSIRPDDPNAPMKPNSVAWRRDDPEPVHRLFP